MVVVVVVELLDGSSCSYEASQMTELLMLVQCRKMLAVTSLAAPAPNLAQPFCFSSIGNGQSAARLVGLKLAVAQGANQMTSGDLE